jgi:ATP-binding cassette, subfamily B, bacterial PglK
VLLIILMLVSAISEIISLGAVLPFIGILTAPDRVFNHPIVLRMSEVFGINSADQMILPITIMFIIAVMVASSIRLLFLWASTRLVAAFGSELSIDVYRRTLYQPFQVHVARNSSEVISSIVSKIDGVIYGVLSPLLIFISSIVLIISIAVFLIAIDPMVAILSIVGFGVSYGLIALVSRNQLRSQSQLIGYQQTQIVKSLQEGLGGIRDVLLDGTQSVYCGIYHNADFPLRRAKGKLAFIAGSPRYIMEAIGMTLIAILAYGLSRQVGGVATALPVLGVLALGAQRVLPALQNLFSAWAGIVGSRSSLVAVVELLEQPMPVEIQPHDTVPQGFHDSVRFDAVSFQYISDGPWVISDLNLNIVRGARIGFVGSTGSGKSTLLDLLMGLLTPTEGELLVDGDLLRGARLRAWQQTITHVPQNIYLTDNTLAENIAFGVPYEAIDMNRVREAASQAQMVDFIDRSPDGYQTVVGERGVRLSGGQRQRIGIARALYREANVLIFDEATSALDNATEQSVMDAIDGLNRDLTVLTIAHRVTTVRMCDIIVQLENGRIVAQGTYDQLIKNSKSFQKLTNVKSKNGVDVVL